MDINNKVFEVLYNGKLAWTTEKEQLFTADGVHPKGAYVTRRSDNKDILGIVGGRYMPMQNSDLCREFLLACEGFNMTNISGVAVDGGKKIVLKAKIGDIQIGKDTVHRYITVSNTHDGSSQVKLGIFNKVLICSNGMMREVDHKELAKVKHTTNAGEKMNWYIRNIPRVLELENEMMSNYQRLADVPVNAKHIQKLIETVYAVDPTLPAEEISARKANQVKEFDKVLTSNGLNVHGNTLWGLLQAQTYIASHNKTGQEEIKYMSGSTLEKSSLTYDLLMSMIDNPIYDTVEG